MSTKIFTLSTGKLPLSYKLLKLTKLKLMTCRAEISIWNNKIRNLDYKFRI